MRICFTVLICLLLIGTSARFTISSSGCRSTSVVSQPAVNLGVANMSLPDIQSTRLAKLTATVNMKALALNNAVRKDVAVAVKAAAVMLLRQSVGRLF